MKLRNKKTGEVKEFNEIFLTKIVRETDTATSEYVERTYHSLAELNEEWEDYKPAEPLVKDEKVRKAVRAWAESLGLQEVYCASNGYEIYGGIDEWVIQFEGEPFPFADKNKIYSIDELCGEGEE